MNQGQARKSVMIMAGGTGGHIFPGLAVAHALKARNIDVVWLGSEGGMETRLVPEQGFAIETLAIKGLRGKGLASLLKAPFTVAGAVAKARALMARHKPDAVVSFGGYTAGPGGVAAYLQGRALLVHEQNCAPGLTNRLLARIAKKVLTGFPNSFSSVANTTVGNPVRPEISALAAPELRYASHGGNTRLLVLGGSQGARAINLLLPTVLAKLADRHAFDIRHQSGEKMHAETEQAYQLAGIDARVEPFIRDMAEAYAWADVVIGRAGALTVSELCAAGVASILIPLPTAVDDHQAMNAEFLKSHGGGWWFRQDERLEKNLEDALLDLASHPERTLQMAKAARSAAFPQAAEQMADIIIQEMAS
jgi:UDP-N-acetylglucosamine--N-acetylmuramyl-(pentapeptide) pyrophosphoryl-undecaprenol N-acetylglucosamine transferase